ncbi:phage repressor protein CI [Pseudocitrobacter cyperus]|uniref:Phage repressor protein CI n=1 Tax=Pseudocitrobacter cyperus TaxID=3112843 RepID=A0ABV0HIQ0_9ENTR
MRIEDLGLNNEDVLDRICEAYGFSQKIQLARHFEIASSSLANRYSRDSISYDFIVHCALETGASLAWLLTGKGAIAAGGTNTDTQNVEKFTLSEESLVRDGDLSIAGKFFSKPLTNPIAVCGDGKLYFIEKEASLADGEWLVDIEGAISIRELTKLPGRKLHVAGGKVPFECGIDDIKALGRVVGVFSEVN